MKKKMVSILLVFCLCVASLLSPTAAFAEETEEGTVLTIRIGDTTYENVTNGFSQNHHPDTFYVHLQSVAI